jgi:hypothetical protein
MKVWRKNKNEVMWNVVNSLLGGMLVFLGSLTSGNITIQGVGFAFIASAIIAITKFRDYWTTQENEYRTNVFRFL